MSEHQALLATFREIHELHKSLAAPLTADQLRTDSFDPDWLVASLLSHMGSTSEIMSASIRASLNGDPAPGRNEFEAIWDHWNALSPEQQRDDSIESNRKYVELLEGLTDDQIDSIRIDFLGDIGGTELLSSLTNEYAMHVWDLDVTFDSTATLLPGAVAPLLSVAPKIAGRYKFGGTPFELQIQTSNPERSLVASFADGVELREGTAETSNTLSAPAEAFVRLVAGRLKSELTPASVSVTGDILLDDLRSVFVGV